MRKIIAKEIIFFFSVIIITTLALLYLIARKYYYTNLSKQDVIQINLLKDSINKLPIDEVELLYEKINNDFVKTYKVGNKTYEVTLEREKEFLKNFPSAVMYKENDSCYKIIKNKTKFRYLDALKAGISKYEIEHLFLDNYYYTSPNISKLLNSNLQDKEINTLLNQDSIVIFNDINKKKFKECLKDSIYREKIYSVFSTYLNLNIRSSFDSKIINSLTRKKDISEVRNMIEGEINKYNKNLLVIKEKIDSNKKIVRISLYIFITLIIIIYPIRLFIIALIWAYKTLKYN